MANTTSTSSQMNPNIGPQYSGTYATQEFEVIVKGDYKYPYKCVRPIIFVPQPAQGQILNGNAFSFFTTISPAIENTLPQNEPLQNTNEIVLWSDGNVPSDTYIQIDLNDGINSKDLNVPPIIPQISPLLLPGTLPPQGENTITTISDQTEGFVSIFMWAGNEENFPGSIDYLLGKDQLNNLPSMITITGSQNIYPTTSRWNNGKLILKPKPLNKYIGNSSFSSKSIKHELITDAIVTTDIKGIQAETITIISNYKDSNNKSHMCYSSLTEPIMKISEMVNFPDLTKTYIWAIPQPTLIYKEPLSANIYLEALNKSFIRDGLHSPNVVVEMYWKGQPIRKELIINEGTSNQKTISYPFPQVIFSVSNSASTSLSSYVVNSGYYRSNTYPTPISWTPSMDQPQDPNAGTPNFHTHATTVDDNGNGETDVPIVLKGNVASHTHIVSNFIALESDGHVHDIKCVAITQINPTTVPALKDNQVTINAYIPYDPTNSQQIVNPPDYPKITGINRIEKVSMMLSQSSFNSQFATSPILNLRIFSANAPLSGKGNKTYSRLSTYSTSATPYITSGGFDIGIEAFFSSYVYEDYPGHFILIPQRNVDDGTRVTIENIWQLPTPPPLQVTASSTGGNGDSSDTEDPIDTMMNEAIGGYTGSSVSMPTNSPRNYLVLNTRATINSEGQVAVANISTNIISSLQWIPDTSGIINEPTNKKEFILNAISNVSSSNTFSIGPSQIYDGVILAANRMIDFNYNNSNGRSYTKMIVLESDGDENLSQNTLAQASSIVNSVDGANKVPIISVIIGNANSIDKVLMTELAGYTGGIVETIRGLSDNGILQIINDIFKSSPTFSSNHIYRVIQNTTAGLPVEISLQDSVLPAGTSVQYRYRTSINGIDWTSYSPYINYNVPYQFDQSMSNLAGYYEYEVLLKPNDLFQSPYITKAPLISHLIPSENIIFFTQNQVSQNSLEYMASVLITHSGVIPDTSYITYGVTQSTSTDPDDYTIAGNDLRPDQQEFLLSRYNELLIQTSYKTYKAINGRWPRNSNISVYQYTSSIDNGVLVNPSLYTTNYAEGSISFISPQSQSYKFVICIELSQFYKLICKIKNYGTKPAIIDHIGMIYNVAKRIPTTTNGTIINKNISDRLGY